MDETLKLMLTLCSTLVGGALAGALVTGIFGVRSAKRAIENEHRQWLRNEKLEAFAKYQHTSQGLSRDLFIHLGREGLPEKLLASFSDYTAARVSLLGSDATTDLIQAHGNAWGELTRHVLNQGNWVGRPDGWQTDDSFNALHAEVVKTRRAAMASMRTEIEADTAHRG